MEFIQKTKSFVKQYFGTYQLPKLTYHSLEHTLIVSEKLLETSKEIGLSPFLQEQLVVAGLLHDIGYLQNLQEHEEESIEIANNYLTKEGKDKEYIKCITNCIQCTKHKIIPHSELSALLKDTDLSYGLYTDFKVRGNQLRNEWYQLFNQQYSGEEWQALQIQFLTDLQFYSSYGKQQFEPLRIAELIKKNP